MNYKDEGGRMK